MPKRILYWFRNDLRLHDNEAFGRAILDAEEIVPVFIFDPRLFSERPTLGIRKTGIFRTNFLLESVADLRQSLQDRGADLIVRVGDAAVILGELAAEIGAAAVYASKEVTQEETDIESTLSKWLKPLNIDLELFWMATLYHVRDLPFGIFRLPDVFTAFRKQVEQQASVRPCWKMPASIQVMPGITPGELPTLPTFGFTEPLPVDNRGVIPFKGGETAALARLKAYFWENNRLRDYKETRNGLLGADYSSKFSPWLALGCLSPRLIFEEVQRYESERIKNESTYWLIFELIWRDYFRFIALKYGTRLFKPSGIKHELHKKWLRDKDLFRCWANGKTGIPFIDANMRELNATGFMSNRGRQNVASFLVSDLGIDWTWGAAYFEGQLIDYDVCSNWGNWNYVAGVGNDPRVYGNAQPRYFNIYRQALQYDPAGDYVHYWLPELANVPSDKVHLVSNLNQHEQEAYGVVLGEDYPLPIVDPNKWVKNEFDAFE